VTTYNPGIYPSGLSFSGNGSYVLNPGVYYVDGFSVQGTVTLFGSGVTLISTGDISFSGTGNVTLAAPSTGSSAGLLFGTTSGSVSITGDSNGVLNGAVYAPNTGVTLTGNSSATAPQNPCFVIVATTVTFTGNSNSSFDNTGCSSLGVPPMYNSPPTTQLIQ
jgi:hypothetical protein